MTHWVDEFLVPLDACKSGIEKARKFSAPQEAWNAWDNSSELLWTLARHGEHDQRKQVLCACDIAERVLPLFEEKYPEDRRPRAAIESARACAESPTEENLRNTYAAASAADCAARSAAYAADASDAALSAANAAASAARAARSAFHAASHAADTASAAAFATADDDIERQAQADIVRKYFPVSPFVKGDKP